jgi:hypothetical protein
VAFTRHFAVAAIACITEDSNPVAQHLISSWEGARHLRDLPTCVRNRAEMKTPLPEPNVVVDRKAPDDFCWTG